jgi:hypothetical protein
MEEVASQANHPNVPAAFSGTHASLPARRRAQLALAVGSDASSTHTDASGVPIGGPSGDVTLK